MLAQTLGKLEYVEEPDYMFSFTFPGMCINRNIWSIVKRTRPMVDCADPNEDKVDLWLKMQDEARLDISKNPS